MGTFKALSMAMLLTPSRLRVADYSEIQTVAGLLPANARVIVVYRSYGASPAVWLDRNVFAINNLDALKPS